MYTELLFNSLDKLQTKPLPSIRHICAFSRGVLNVRFMRSHPTLAPRPQICLIEGNGFCAVAGEDELNRRRRFGDRSWCLLLTWEWLGIEGMSWLFILLLLFYYIPYRTCLKNAFCKVTVTAKKKISKKSSIYNALTYLHIYRMQKHSTHQWEAEMLQKI